MKIEAKCKCGAFISLEGNVDWVEKQYKSWLTEHSLVIKILGQKP